VGGTLEGRREGGGGWATFTNPSHPNFHLFWTQVGIYFRARRM
jgi:hypothetical protein